MLSGAHDQDQTVDLAELLSEMNAGQPGSLDRFARLVQAELRRIAASYLRREWSADSLQPTELVNECFMRLFRGESLHWNGRAHFFGVAAHSMRQILVDRARRRKALKRPPEALQVQLEDLNLASEGKSWLVLALHQALDRLEAVDSRLVRTIELRVFAGLTVEETADVLQVATATVKRDWAFALAWLHRELS